MCVNVIVPTQNKILKTPVFTALFFICTKNDSDEEVMKEWWRIYKRYTLICVH